MAEIEIIQPIMQTTKAFRLLDWIETQLLCDDYNSFKCTVAFAKAKPLYKIHDALQAWKAHGKTAEAIIGIDLKGTSSQALQYVHANFDKSYVLHADNATFHPKLYLFYGDKKAAIYCGSNNLTPGGLETNFECGIVLYLKLPDDQGVLEQALASFNSLLPASIPCTSCLDKDLIKRLNLAGLLADESSPAKKRQSTGPSACTESENSPTDEAPLFGKYHTKPPRALSKTAMTAAAASAGISIPDVHTTAREEEHTPGSSETAPNIGSGSSALTAIVDGLVIQVVPHHNGEIFLSKNAINQNPEFFNFPFTGLTVPKKAGNKAYPQRIPDPVVNIYVYDASGECVHTEKQYNLNTVFYSVKSEVRITITPSILEGLHLSEGGQYPVLVMRNSVQPECDYDLLFYEQGSREYDEYLSICNQTLPSGGKPIARKMGWI